MCGRIYLQVFLTVQRQMLKQCQSNICSRKVLKNWEAECYNGGGVKAFSIGTVNKSQDNKGDYMQKSKGQEEHLEPQKKLKK
jgi:hypothetical protein